ncbi:GNAT family acetyltransferase [Ktedonobacter sp. SOSP1-85]|uniref:GNAT family acetyltransferase n=1 Tax=Ktedonobacter sp. SOSP1-85 TaxID=2778367 RepID=UPI001916A922|nr:GNAT family acetyltransferase [Ktedonobacter sp. SOSP1-85]
MKKEQSREERMHIRDFQIEDYDEVVTLWKQAGLVLSSSDNVEGIRQKLERDADLFLVAASERDIIGVVMGCYDGRRGWINHLAVAPSAQGQRVGARLMQEVERRLAEKGCAKVNLLIEPTNASVQAFYQKNGYQRDELIFMEKWL